MRDRAIPRMELHTGMCPDDGRGWVMDDFPASAASHRPRRPLLSVVIPVHNGGHDFDQCLRGLCASTWRDFETIVVDDGSTDGSGERAEAVGARVIRLSQMRGPATARNVGVEVS